MSFGTKLIYFAGYSGIRSAAEEALVMRAVNGAIRQPATNTMTPGG